MRQLFQRASFLFWQYPILWVPVLVADLATFTLRMLQKVVARAIVEALRPHSVFGVDSGPLNPASESIPRIAILSGATFLIMQFLCILLYCAAFGLTAQMVHRRLVPAEAMGELDGETQWRAPRRVVMLTGKIFGLVVLASLTLGPLSLVFIKYPISTSVSVPVWGYLAGVLLEMAVAYIAAPIAIRWLVAAGSRTIGREAMRRAQMFAILGVAAVGTVGWCTSRVATAMIGQAMSYSEVIVIQAVASLIAAVPYVLLFIVFALIAYELPGDMPIDLVDEVDGGEEHKG